MPVITYQCPNCGGGLLFDPESQKYKCEYCLSLFSEGELKDLFEKEEGRREPEAMVIYHCPSCGAEIVTDDTTAASFCYYCHNPVVLSGRLLGRFAPDEIIPFTIDREKAVEIFNQWIGRKRFVPKAFYSPDQIEKITGVYFPYWLYSCQIHGELDGVGDQITIHTMGGIRSTETRRYRVRREGEMDVKNVPRNALRKANHEIIEGVLPFHTGRLKPFSMGYLTGFFAEKRDIEYQEFQGEMADEMRKYATESLRASVENYNQVQVEGTEIRVIKEKWHYALLPVWTLTYRDEKGGKVYYFALNGDSGKVCGRLPVDKNRLMELFFTVFFPVLIALLIGGYLI